MRCMLCGEKLSIKFGFDNLIGKFCAKCARKVFRAYWEQYWRRIDESE